MAPLPSNINKFLLKNHVLGLATLLAGEPWAASCFYAFDAESISLIILSSEQTRHGLAMLEHATVAGTIAGQPTLIPKIQGIQFVANALMLEDAAGAEVYELYCRRHPIARLKRSTVWRLYLQEIKFTDNALLLGNKTHWQREISGNEE